MDIAPGAKFTVVSRSDATAGAASAVAAAGGRRLGACVVVRARVRLDGARVLCSEHTPERRLGSDAAIPVRQVVPALVGRRGTPSEVAAMVRYLAGPNARFITGQTLHVNGGSYLA